MSFFILFQELGVQQLNGMPLYYFISLWPVIGFDVGKKNTGCENIAFSSGRGVVFMLYAL